MKDADEKIFFRVGEIDSVAGLASSESKCEVPGTAFWWLDVPAVWFAPVCVLWFEIWFQFRLESCECWWILNQSYNPLRIWRVPGGKLKRTATSRWTGRGKRWKSWRFSVATAWNVWPGEWSTCRSSWRNDPINDSSVRTPTNREAWMVGRSLIIHVGAYRTTWPEITSSDCEIKLFVRTGS